MKIVVTCQPALGHFHPLVPLARELEQAGHSVTFPTSASFCPFVRDAGFAAVAAGADWLESEPELAFPELVRDAESWHSPGVTQAVFARAAQALALDLVRLIRATRPDLVISESVEWAGPLSAEVTGVPHAQFGIDALTPLPVLAAKVGWWWCLARKALGLPDDPTLDRLSPYLYLDAFPPSLHPMPEHESSQVVASVQPVLCELGEPTPPSWLEMLPARPSVYVTMGTVVNRAASVFSAVLAALSDELVNVIVTVGPTRDPATLGDQPRHIRIEQYVRQSHVLPHVDLVVAHGGYNTMIGALMHGIPMLLLPYTHDQRYNAFAVERCGAGLRLEPRTAPAAQLKAAINELLANPIYRHNAARLQAELATLPPVRSAIPLLERLVG